MSERTPATQNQLSGETSPYLLQHAHNPVAWHPWGPEALRRAREEQKPVFLSIGYSACHWCHVMERESFENPAIAALMNERYVNIKVDREERPDIDEIYMKAVTALTGSGGWPLSVFLTPELKPFYGATYLPPERRYGRPSFPDVLTALAQAWNEQRQAVVDQAEQLTAAIAAESRTDLRGELDADLLPRAHAALLQSVDTTWGGFGTAPKFPHSGDIRLLLRGAARDPEQRGARLDAATLTLDRMASGGIYDQLGGGFHRYSTDDRWCIPHFEKMLYDNALLIVAYLDAHLLTGRADFARVARETCDWALTEMVTPEGGFASAQDADSEGEEGRFFAWTPQQLGDVLGERLGAWAAAYFDVTDAGNFEHGKSALWRPRPAEAVAAELGVDVARLESEMKAARAKLLAARSARVHPATDDKVLVAWNGLMISALASAHQVLDEPRYREAAQRAARYVLGEMRQPDGRLFATARSGHAHINACLDDYVFLVQGLIDLYESDFDEAWLRHALALAEIVETSFVDLEHGGYCTTGMDHEPLLVRTRNLHDAALPSGTGVEALNLARLALLCGRAAWTERAHEVMRSQASVVNKHPRLFGHLLLALDFVQAGPIEVVISGDPQAPATHALLDVVRRTYLPARVVALAHANADSGLVPLTLGRLPASKSEKPLAYLCRNFTCNAPIADAAALHRALLGS
jgi:uncharacterized protein